MKNTSKKKAGYLRITTFEREVFTSSNSKCYKDIIEGFPKSGQNDTYKKYRTRKRASYLLTNLSLRERFVSHRIQDLTREQPLVALVKS